MTALAALVPCAEEDETDGALGVAVGAVVGAYGQEARELALGAGVRLDGHRVVTGDLGETLLQLTDEREVAAGLLDRGEGVDLAELRPGDRLHLGGRVQLHRAGAERDHAAVQRVVPVGQLAQVAQHRRLGAVLVEHGVREVVVGPQQGRGQGLRGHCVQGLDVGLDAEGGPHGGQLRAGGGLVAGDKDGVGVDEVEVDPALAGRGDDLGGLARHPRGQRVEVRAVHDLHATGPQALGEDACVAVGALRDRPQTLGAVVHRVHSRHHGEQHLGGADVAGGLLTADVLLTGLQRKPVRLVSVGVHGDPDQAAGQAARELVADGHIAGVRAAEAHGDAEALRGADRDVRAQLAGRGEQRQRQQIGGDGDDRAQPVRLLDDRLDVTDGAGGAGVLEQHAEDTALGDLGGDALAQVGSDDLDTGRLGAGPDHREGLRQDVRVDQENAFLDLADPAGERHGLGRGRALVEQRSARGGQTGQVGDHRLEVEQRLQAALGDLGLVGRVRGVPGRVLHDIAQDDRGREGAVVAETDHRREHLVAVGQGAQLGEYLGLRAGARKVQGLRALDHIGDRGGGQLVERAVPHLRQHLGLGLGVGPDVALLEGDALLQLGERNAVGGHLGGLLVRHDRRGAPRRGCPDGLPLCHLNLRASPARHSGTPAFTVGESGCRPTPALLSRVTSSVRYRGLRDSGEDLLLRRQPVGHRWTLPHGVSSRLPEYQRGPSLIAQVIARPSVTARSGACRRDRSSGRHPQCALL